MVQGYSPIFDKKAGGKTFLLKAEKDDQMSIQSSVIRDAVEKGLEVAFIGFQHPHKQLREKLDLSGTQLDNVWFIDCITREVGGKESDKERVSFVRSPHHLDHVRHNISMVTQKIDKDLLIILDSLPAILAFNDEKRASEFLRRTIESAETYDARCLLFKVSSELDSLIGDTVYPFIDEFLIMTDDKLEVLKKNEELYIHLIPDIMRALDWEVGNKLDYNIEDSRTIEFYRK